MGSPRISKIILARAQFKTRFERLRKWSRRPGEPVDKITNGAQPGKGIGNQDPTMARNTPFHPLCEEAPSNVSLKP